MIVFAAIMLQASFSSALEIRFDDEPGMGLPDDARDQKCKRVDALGSLKDADGKWLFVFFPKDLKE